jgi:hypothetical protein
MSIEQKQTKRTYRKITPRTVANHAAQVILEGSGTAAVRATNPEYKAPHIRAHAIIKKNNSVNVAEYIEDSLQQIGGEAIDRIGELVQSEDERIATKNAHFVVEHIRGKAVQRNITGHVKLNIQSVLD